MINAIIIDDEEHNRSVLKTLLDKHCPLVNLINEADNVDDAFILINRLKPNLIFLDIRMPGKNGFELLKLFDKIDFEVIFVSGFDEYALAAFEYNALGYILKPIDYEKLIKAVNKAIEIIKLANSNPHLINFISSVDEHDGFIKKISVHQSNKVVFIDIKDIEYIEHNDSFCEINTKKGEKFISTKELTLFENLLRKFNYFIRINRSIIINVKSIKKYSKGEVCITTLESGREFEVSRRKKSEIISILGA